MSPEAKAGRTPRSESLLRDEKLKKTEIKGEWIPWMCWHTDQTSREGSTDLSLVTHYGLFAPLLCCCSRGDTHSSEIVAIIIIILAGLVAMQ